MDSDGFDFISAIMMINSRNDHVCMLKKLSKQLF